MLALTLFGTFQGFGANHVFGRVNLGGIRSIESLIVMDSSLLIFNADTPRLYMLSRRRVNNSILTWVGLYRHLKPLNPHGREGGYFGAGMFLLDRFISGKPTHEILEAAAGSLSRLAEGNRPLNFLEKLKLEDIGLRSDQLESAAHYEQPLPDQTRAAFGDGANACCLDISSEVESNALDWYLEGVQREPSLGAYGFIIVSDNKRLSDVLRLGGRVRMFLPSAPAAHHPSQRQPAQIGFDKEFASPSSSPNAGDAGGRSGGASDLATSFAEQDRQLNTQIERIDYLERRINALENHVRGRHYNNSRPYARSLRDLTPRTATEVAAWTAVCTLVLVLLLGGIYYLHGRGKPSRQDAAAKFTCLISRDAAATHIQNQQRWSSQVELGLNTIVNSLQPAPAPATANARASHDNEEMLRTLLKSATDGLANIEKLAADQKEFLNSPERLNCSAAGGG
jgi:hypothetical protein